MKVKYIITTAFVTFLSACSFTQPANTQKNTDTAKVSSVKTSSVPKYKQNQVFNLIIENDVNSLEGKLQALNPEDFSFTDSSGQTPADLLFELNDKAKIDIFVAHGLSIYDVSTSHLNTYLDTDKELAEKYLSRLNPSTETQASSTTQMLSLHQQKTQGIYSLLLADKQTEAYAAAKKYEMPCSILAPSLLYTSNQNAQRPKTSTLWSLLEKVNCTAGLSTSEVTALYLLEARRQTQDRFSDPELLIKLMNHPALHDKMIPVESFGLKISPFLLARLSISCLYTESETLENGQNKITHEADCSESDFGDDLLYGPFAACKEGGYEKSCFTKNSVADTAYDIMLIESGKVTFAAEGAKSLKNLSIFGPPAFAYFYGESMSTDSWKNDAISGFLRPDGDLDESLFHDENNQ